MVAFMDIAEQGNGVTGCIPTDSALEEPRSANSSIVENLPFSIPKSRIFYYHEFSCSKIGDGFYGDVFKVQHRLTKQVMVLKISKPDRESEDCTMLDEIKLLNRLSHQNIIRFLGICIEESRVHLLCEYVDGGNLEDLLMNHSVQLEWAARIYLARDIAKGMEYLHERGIIHRDLTSKNCLVKVRHGWWYAIVADLGLATEIKAQSIVGSPFNMAPELIRGEAYDEKADVFSYGIILCEIIGRVQADPDELPRTNTFGLDVEKFQLMIGDCPLEFLQAALCCCQMESSSRPTFTETVRHLEFLLVEYERRPELDETTDETALQRRESSSLTTMDVKHVNAQDNNNVTDTSTSPAIIVNTEASHAPKQSTEKRRQSWIAGRHKVFNTATEDLIKNTPGKLKKFFHRVLRVRHTHFHPANHKAHKDGSKESSPSELRRFSLLDSEKDCDKLASGAGRESTSGSFPMSNSGGRSSHRSISDLRLSSPDAQSEAHSLSGVRYPRSKSMFSTSRRLPKSPRSCTNSRIASESETPVSGLLDHTKRVRCRSMPAVDKPLTGRLTKECGCFGECEMNSAHSTLSELQTEGTGATLKLKLPLKIKIFRRKSTKNRDKDPNNS